MFDASSVAPVGTNVLMRLGFFLREKKIRIIRISGQSISLFLVPPLSVHYVSNNIKLLKLFFFLQ